MFSITVQSEFCAAHALVIAGTREPLHGHNFRVWVTMEGPSLDQDGLLCDFHTVQDVLGEVLRPLDNQNLHDTKQFANTNPSAENIARHIADELHNALGQALHPHARIARVRVSEAPGCVAEYSPITKHA
jgi:6-pyruvoyltetrahydropterin/6-carboxytetrahydropterin synthase